METNNDYKSAYSEEGFWDKLKKFASKAGKEVVTNALRLYYAMALGKATPAEVIAIIAALGYFISPVDFVPDVTPLVGYVDDGGVAALVIKTVISCSDSEVVAAAEEKAKEWFD